MPVWRYASTRLLDLLPQQAPACCASLAVDSARFGLVGFTTTPIAVELGTISCSSSNCFATRRGEKLLTPVTFPPGRLRLVTSPSSTGSGPASNTIGIVVVAALAPTAS